MSATRFEPESSSSEIRLYVLVWYDLFTCRRLVEHTPTS